MKATDKLRAEADKYEKNGEPGPMGYNFWGWRVFAQTLRALANEIEREEVKTGPTDTGERTLIEALEAVLMDASVTYGIVGDDGSSTPMMVERGAIVRALGYEDESAWLKRTAEINRLAAALSNTPEGVNLAGIFYDEGFAAGSASAGPLVGLREALREKDETIRALRSRLAGDTR